MAEHQVVATLVWIGQQVVGRIVWLPDKNRYQSIPDPIYAKMERPQRLEVDKELTAKLTHWEENYPAGPIDEA